MLENEDTVISKYYKEEISYSPSYGNVIVNVKYYDMLGDPRVLDDTGRSVPC